MKYLVSGLMLALAPSFVMAQTIANPVVWPQSENFYSNQNSKSHRVIEQPSVQPSALGQNWSALAPNQQHIVSAPQQPNMAPYTMPAPAANYGQPMNYGQPLSSTPWNGMPNVPSMPNMNHFSVPYPNSVTGMPSPMNPMGTFNSPMVPSVGMGQVSPFGMMPGGNSFNGLPFGVGR
jgi:hypothetical protein